MTRRTRVSVLRLTVAAIALLALAWGAARPVRAAGAIWYVNDNATGANSGTSWADAFADLQSALAAAASGDQIWVAAGTYRPGPSGDRNASFTLQSGVAVYGGFAGGETLLAQRDWQANTTTLSGDLNGDDGPSFANNSENSYRVVIGATGATLDGFTVSGGNANDAIGNGGGIYSSGTSPVLSNLVVTGNSATNGGGIALENSSATLTSSTVISNTASAKGGGIAVSGGSPAISNVTISYNTSVGDGGGIVNRNGASTTLTNATISHNRNADSEGNGGGGGGIANIQSNTTLTNLTISNNIAGGGGGLSNENCTPTITNATISGNTGSLGGAIFNVSGGNPSLTNVIISGNSASLGGAITNFNGSVTLTNATISGNNSTSGGAISTTFGGNPVIRNSIIWGNTSGGSPGAITGNSATVSYSIIEGGYGGTGNQNADPLFVASVPAAPSTSGDLHLRSDSPAIDAGNNNVTSPSLPATDRDGNARRLDVPLVADGGSGTNPIVDLGAYEARFASVSSITRLSPSSSSTNASSVVFRVVFDQSLGNLDASDFAVVVDGNISGASVAGVSGSGATYSVTVGTGSGDGELRLDVPATARATDSTGFPIGLIAFTGDETYAIDKTATAPLINAASANTGAVTSGGTTTDPTLILNGTAEAGTTITLSRVGVGVIGTTTADAIGIWNIDYSATILPPGTYSFTATATDPLGNTSAASSPFVVTVRAGTIWYVNDDATGANSGTSWADAFTSLQDALATALDTDQIWVAAGTYRPSSSGDRNASFQLKQGVAIYGGFAGSETVLAQRDWQANPSTLSGDLNGDDGPSFANNSENSISVVRASAAGTLDGFTISGGNAGNGIGGGVVMVLGSSTLRNLVVSGNRAGTGGGVFIDGGNTTLANITVSGNRASQRGGGMAFQNATLSLSQVVVSNNIATNGGGLFISGGNTALADVTISGNSASQFGGGMMLQNAQLSESRITVSGNSATDGGGIAIESGTPALTNAVISGNTSTQTGGAIFNDTASPTLTNVTISGNSAANGIGGIASTGPTILRVRNSIIWGNSPGTISNEGGDAFVSYSIVQGGHDGTGNRDTDPLFVSAVPSTPSTGGDLRLQLASSAIDAGDNSVTSPALPATDRDGSPRLVDVPTVADSGNGSAPVVDMGAYERQRPNTPPSLDQPASLTLLEDAGEQVVNLTGIGAGDSGQTVSISAFSSDPALIPNPTASYTSPSSTGSLRFTPIANANGSATISVVVRDNGGTTSGGTDTLTRTLTVQITPVNDAPSFSAGPDQTVASTAGPQTVAGWATGFSPGPPNESSQSVLGYSVTSNSAPELFDAAPALSELGTLTYTPKPGASGTATIIVAVRDSGGTANGGVDTSAVRTFTITVTSGVIPPPGSTVYLPLVMRGR